MNDYWSYIADKNDAELLHFYLGDEKYLSEFREKNGFANIFLEQYHRSLFYYKHFYDDVSNYGNEQECREVFYFIPGFNGAPGQVRFGIPGIVKTFGPHIYIRCLYVQEFSVRYPYWLKYTEKNLKKRRDQIVKDLFDLARTGKKIRVFTSSTAFYEFLAIYPEIIEIKDRIVLYWGSCAPDSVTPSRWEGLFDRLNGFSYNGMRWYAYPNHHFLKKFNPECNDRFRWSYKGQKNTFYLNDIESRFFVAGFLWDLISIDCFNFFIKNNLEIFQKKGQRIDMEVHVLAATNDGFWDDSSVENINRTVDRYVKNKQIIFEKRSHLWLVTPENIARLLDSEINGDNPVNNL